jgi:DeoR/GlpR family transcriptional regulator of sugar metabolism
MSIEKAVNQKLTDDQVREIRAKYVSAIGRNGFANVIELANSYGVAQETIRKVAKRKTYKWVS